MRKRAFTLIELVMIIAIISVLSVIGGIFMARFIQSSMFIPNQLNMNMIASNALDIMIEGDSQARGMRFLRSVTLAGNNQVTFNNQNSHAISYRLDVPTNRLYRSIDAAIERLIPYYVPPGADVVGNGAGGRLFTYYDENDILTAVAADVRRVRIDLIVRTGTGSYADWEGETEQSSSVAVHRFE